MEILIQQAEQLPENIQDLVIASKKEGFEMIQRLVDEYEQGTNRFDRKGEFLLTAYVGNKLVGCGGLNIQFSEDAETNQNPSTQRKIGRVRRFYVLPEYRREGVAKRLLQELEKRAKPQFSALCLHTDINHAVQFYTKQNYVFVEHHPSYNYFKYLV